MRSAMYGPHSIFGKMSSSDSSSFVRSGVADSPTTRARAGSAENSCRYVFEKAPCASSITTTL